MQSRPPASPDLPSTDSGSAELPCEADRILRLHARLAAVALRAPMALARVSLEGSDRTAAHGPTDPAGFALWEAAHARLASGGEPVRMDADAAGPGEAVAVVGVHLPSPDRAARGSLCVLDPAPRRWTDEEAGVLAELAHAAAAQLEALHREHRRAREAEGSHRALVEEVGAIVWESDPETFVFTFVSPHAEALLGYPLRRWREEPGFWAGMLHPEDREAVIAACVEATREGRDHVLEYRVAAADGRTVWLHDIARVVRGPDGSVRRLRGIMMDVTERREAEQRAQRMAGRMRAVASAAAGLLGARTLRQLHDVLREATRSVLAYDALTVALYDPEAHGLLFLGSHDQDLFEPGELIPLAGTPSERVIRDRRTLRTHRSDDPASRGARPFGSPRPSESTLRTPVLDGSEVLGVLSVQSYTPDLYTDEDVEVLEAVAALAATVLRNVQYLTEREEALAALREAEERQQRVYRQIPAVIWTTDRDLRITSLQGGEVSRDPGEPNPYLGVSLAALFPAGDPPLEAHRNALRGSNAAYRLDWNGRIFKAQVHPLREKGRITGVAGVALDVTQSRRAEEALRESEEKYRALFEQVPAGVFFYDRELRVTAFNERFQAMANLPRERLVGYPIFEIQDLRVLPTFEPVLRGEASTYEGPYLTPSGVEMWIVIRVAPLRDAAGTVIGGVGVVEDHTPQRRAEQERVHLLEREQAARADAEMAARRARFLAEASDLFTASLDHATTLESLSALLVPRLAESCIVYLLDPEGGVQRLGALHADPERQLRLRDRLERYAPELECLVPPVAHVLRTGAPLSVAPGDSRTWEERGPCEEERGDLDPDFLLVLPLRARERILGAISLGFEARRVPGSDDRALLEEVARRAALAVDNAQLHGEVQKALQTRKKVMQAVSHDLRNPLASILLNSTSLLSPRLSQELAPAVRDALGTITLAAEQMERLIQDLLDVTRLEAGHFAIDRSPQELMLLVGSGLSLLQPIAERRSVGLVPEQVGEIPVLHLDGGRILQVLSNLVENAVKFTPEGGEVRVRVEAMEDGVRVSVADTGPGIEEAHLPHLFTPFWQGVPSGRQGAGLGLTIARGIVEAHGGRIGVEPRPGGGSIFHFTLPARGPLPAGRQGLPASAPARPARAPVPERPREGSGVPAPAPGERPVLVVDDNVVTRHALTYVLRQAGHAVVEAADGEEGIRQAREHEPAAILMDLNMPVMDGWTATRRLRGGAAGACPPVAAVTAQILSPLEQAEAETLFDEVLPKPVTADRLLETVGRLLAGRVVSA